MSSRIALPVNLAIRSPSDLHCDLSYLDHLPSLERIKPCDRAWVRQSCASYRKQLAALKRATIYRDENGAKEAISVLLDSKFAKICSVLRVVKAGRFDQLKKGSLSRSAIRAQAERIDLFKPLKGKASIVRVTVGAKKRMTLNFSGVVRASQFILVDLLSAAGYRSLIDFNSKGRGPQAVAREIISRIDDGAKYFCIFDIANNFRSVQCAHLNWLPLPVEVLSYVVFPNRYIHIEGGKSKTLRSGLPLGSPLSTLINSALIGRKLQLSVGGECRALSFADDICIASRSKSSLRRAAKLVFNSFATDPNGAFLFKHFTNCRHKSVGFDYLGFNFRARSTDKHVKILPALAATERRQLKIFEMAKKDGFSFDALFESELETYVRRWSQYYALRPHSENWVRDTVTISFVSAVQSCAELSGGIIQNQE